MTIQPQPHRLSVCLRHPGEPVTGFCALCLQERLAGLNTPTHREVSGVDRNVASSSSSLPELRRCKSFSGGKREGFTGAFEPRRKSCDVRIRNSLWSLFSLEDERKGGLIREIVAGTGKLGPSENVGTVFEGREEEDSDGEIRVLEEVLEPDVNVIDIGAEIEEEVGVMTMKEHIDLELRSRKRAGRDLKDIAGSFWVAASVFSNKLRKWRQKQKVKKHCCGGEGGSVAIEVEKVNGKNLRLRETQSEIGEYGFGRRSCDTDPRFSIDAGRLSLDGARYSFDEPRVSGDGYLTGRMLPRLVPPPMVSVIEDVGVLVNSNANHLTVDVEEKMNSVSEEGRSPGGSAQTRDYYSARRWRSFDQSSSNRKAIAEMDDMKTISNAKVSPATVELFHGAKLLVTERASNLSSGKDDRSDSLDSSSKDAASIGGGGDGKGFTKSIRWRKACTIWGLIHKRNESKYEVESSSPAESWVNLGRESNGDVREVADNNIIGCNGNGNGSVSSTSSCKMTGSFSSMKSSADTNEYAKKKRENCVLERNRSSRYSPNNIDNGLLRFYLTPFSRSRSKFGKNRLKKSHSTSKSVSRLY